MRQLDVLSPVRLHVRALQFMGLSTLLLRLVELLQRFRMGMESGLRRLQSMVVWRRLLSRAADRIVPPRLQTATSANWAWRAALPWASCTCNSSESIATGWSNALSLA